MPLIFTFPIFVSIIGGASLGVGAFKLTGSETIGLLVTGIMIIVIDVVQRCGTNSNVPAIDPEVGGHIYFIPGWVFGVIVTVVGICAMLGFVQA